MLQHLSHSKHIRPIKHKTPHLLDPPLEMADTRPLAMIISWSSSSSLVLWPARRSLKTQRSGEILVRYLRDNVILASISPVSHIYTYLQISTQIYTHLHIYTHIGQYLTSISYLHISTHIYTDIHTSTHIYPYIHIYTHIYTYIHIYSRRETPQPLLRALLSLPGV